MTAAAVARTVSARCRLGDHNRCPGLLPRAICGCSCGHKASRNVRAAGAVVLNSSELHPNGREFHADALELLAMIGVIDRDTEDRVVLPDPVGGVRVPTMGPGPGAKADEPGLRAVDEEDLDDDVLDVVHAPRSKRVTTPPGLAALPPPAPPVPRPKPRGLQAELDELERTDPDVAAAAASYDRMVERITSKPLKVAAQPKPKATKKKAPTPAKAEAARPAAGSREKAAPVKAPRPPRELVPIKHGTLTGYTMHSQRKVPIPPDDPCGCRAARKKYDDGRTAAKKAAAATAKPTPKALPAKRLAPVLPPIAHGTAAGWQAHHDRGALPVCDVCEAAVAPPPAPKTIPVTELLAGAQRSRDPGVVRAASKAIRLLVQIQAAGAQSLADGRIAARLEAALAEVTRAQTRAASRTNGTR